MKVKIRDLETGEEFWHPNEDVSVYEWEHGNFSCDCNRHHPDNNPFEEGHFCVGCKRFIVVELQDAPPEASIEEMNYEYLIDKSNSGARVVK